MVNAHAVDVVASRRAVERVPLPKGATGLWAVYINAQASRLDVLALLTVDGKTAYWATQVAPAS